MAHLRPVSKKQLTIVALLSATCASLRAQCPLAGPDGASKLLTFAGQISVIRPGSGNYAWALNACDAVKPQEVVVTGPDGWGVFQVADGSKFEVYPNSRVVFRANQGDWRDLLEVWLGKIRVQIEHIGGLPNNNKVRTPTAVISVRGTIFIVEVEPDTHTTLVQDEEGVVVVNHLLKPSEIVLQKGEYVRVFENERIGKAVFDKGGLLQRVAKAAQDAFYQAAMNRNASIGHAPTTASTGSTPADKNSGGTAPAPPPPAAAPPPPPQFMPQGTSSTRTLDWSKCSAVEKAAPEDGGQWVLRGTLVPATAILQALDGGENVDALSSRYPRLDRKLVEAVAAFARKN